MCIRAQVHVFVGGVEEKLMANKAIKQVVEVMQTSSGKMGRVQEILRCVHCWKALQRAHSDAYSAFEPCCTCPWPALGLHVMYPHAIFMFAGAGALSELSVSTHLHAAGAGCARLCTQACFTTGT